MELTVLSKWEQEIKEGFEFLGECDEINFKKQQKKEKKQEQVLERDDNRMKSLKTLSKR